MTETDAQKSQLKILDLGCGKNKRAGAIGVDHSNKHEADIIHDLNVFPYPFEHNSIDEIYLDNTLEHLDSPIDVMVELYRICKVGASIKVIVPYFRSYWASIDPTHKTFFTVDSFAYYDPEHVICQKYDYVNARFKVERIIFNEGVKDKILTKLVVKLANKFPQRYEHYLSHLYPLHHISYYLRKV